MPIKVLSPEVISRIAAGEVVDRPASVVKELIENSLDAAATQITVEARSGGLGLIRVADNGVGIGCGELEKAFERYATSKVSSLSDLDSIRSLGFRGEALPSIAAVAGVETISCAGSELAGCYLRLKNGQVIEKGTRGSPQGTTVTVRDLFRDFPARLKFLKSSSTENGHISNMVSQYSLAFPEVRFTLIIDGRVVLKTPGNGSLRDALVQVYGVETARAMLKVTSPQVSGLISPPELSRSSRSYLSFFVNRRWVQSRILSRALEEAYHGLLMTGKHPITTINLSLPYEDVDVNVHPAKSEVRFRQEQRVFTLIHNAVRMALMEQMPVPMLRSEPSRETPVSLPIERMEVISMPEAEERLVEPPPGESPPPRIPILRVLGQLSNTYIIAEGPDGLYLIDQHAAHERVLFERIWQGRAGRGVEVQGLLEPITIEVTARQGEILRRRWESLADYGFAIEPFGERTYLVRSVPSVLGGHNLTQKVLEVIDSLDEGDASPDWEERITISLACHGAVKAGQQLSDAEMKELVRQLEQTSSPRTCPHGRPTMVHLSSWQLEKGFGRR